MAKRICSILEHSSEEERSYFQKKAEQLGYNTLSAFMREAMNEKITLSEPLLSTFLNIAKLCADAEIWLQEVEEPTSEEAEALKVLRHIYQVVIRTKIMEQAEENYKEMPPEMLDGEEPHKEYRFARVKDKLADEVFNL